MSADTAILAGGEFPIPVAQSSAAGNGGNTITVECKQSGSRWVTPTILKDGLITRRQSEVSAIDPLANSVRLRRRFSPPPSSSSPAERAPGAPTFVMFSQAGWRFVEPPNH